MLLFHEIVRVNAGLPEYCPQRTFRHVAGVVGDGGKASARGILPDLVGTRRLTMEFESEALQAAYDLPVAEARETTHLTRSRSADSRKIHGLPEVGHRFPRGPQ